MTDLKRLSATPSSPLRLDRGDDPCAPNPGKKSPSCVVKDDHTTLFLPRTDKPSEVCKDGGTVHVLRGFREPNTIHDRGPIDDAKDERADAKMKELEAPSERKVREAARRAGCRVEEHDRYDVAEGQRAYYDPKTVAVVHQGHGDKDGTVTTSRNEHFGADKLDKAKVSPRLQHAELNVCYGGEVGDALKAKLPAGATTHGTHGRTITHTEAVQHNETDIPARLRAKLRP